MNAKYWWKLEDELAGQIRQQILSCNGYSSLHSEPINVRKPIRPFDSLWFHPWNPAYFIPRFYNLYHRINRLNCLPPSQILRMKYYSWCRPLKSVVSPHLIGTWLGSKARCAQKGLWSKWIFKVSTDWRPLKTSLKGGKSAWSFTERPPWLLEPARTSDPFS